MLDSHTVISATLLLIQLYANGLGNAKENGSSICRPANDIGALVEHPTLGLNHYKHLGSELDGRSFPPFVTLPNK